MSGNLEMFRSMSMFSAIRMNNPGDTPKDDELTIQEQIDEENDPTSKDTFDDEDPGY